jgi:REP element-mobilizing transposase RayT
VSHVHRLRTSDRILFVTVNPRRTLPPLAAGEFELVANDLAESRRRLRFLLLGYVVMPDHWHALIWPAYPLTISRLVQDVKWISSGALNRSRHSSGSVWQH